MTVSTSPHQIPKPAFHTTRYTNIEETNNLAWIHKITSTFKQTSGLVPVLALSIALIGIACASIFIVIAEQEISPSATTFHRLLIAAIAFGTWNGLQQFIRRQSSTTAKALPINRHTLRDLVLLLVAGISFAASLTLSAWSLTQTSVANSALLNNMMPIFTTLGAWLLLGQRFSLRFLLGIVVALGGIVAIAIEDLHIAGTQIAGDGAALLAAVLAATTILSIEQLRLKFSTPTIMIGTSLIGSLLILPTLVLSNNPVFPTSWTSSLAVLALALISQVIGHGLLTYSLKQFSSGVVSVSMLAIPAIAAILAMFIFKEQLSLLNWFAFLIVLIGIYLSVSASRIEMSEVQIPNFSKKSGISPSRII